MDGVPVSILTGDNIYNRIGDGSIVCDPGPEKVGPNSMDLRLGRELLVYSLGPSEPIDSRSPPSMHPVPIDPETKPL